MKLSVRSGYVYFAAGILLVTAVTFTGLTCPVDGGTGIIKGADGLTVTDVEYTLDNFETFDTGCAEIYSDFSYSVNITLVNDTAVTKNGALLVKFYDPSAVKGVVDLATVIAKRAEEQEMAEHEIIVTEEVSKGGLIATFLAPPVATKFISTELPARAEKTLQETIEFRGFGYEEVSQFGMEGITHAVSVAPPMEAIICPYSHGTGKVPLTEWLRLRWGF